MRKLVTLFAATTLLVSSIAFAEEGQTTTNSNDVLQTIPHEGNNAAEGVNIADASNTTSTDAAKTEDAAKSEDAAKTKAPVAAKKHHCNKHNHHCKKHHHHKKAVKMSGPSQPNDSTPTQH